MNNRIAEILKSEGLTNSQFANLIGVQASAVTHILNGRNDPSLKVVKSILDNFRGINPDWLIAGIGEMYRKSPEIVENKVDSKPKAQMHPVQQSLFPEYPIPTQEYGKENELNGEAANNAVSDVASAPNLTNGASVDPYASSIFANPQSVQPSQAAAPGMPQGQVQPVAQTQPQFQPQIQSQFSNQPKQPLNYGATPYQQPYQAPVEEKKEKPASVPVPPRVVKKIVVFYSDNTYEEYGAQLHVN